MPIINDNANLRNLALILLGALFLGVVGGSLGGAWIAIEYGALGVAGEISTFASAVATTALVFITAFYAWSTWQLVNETKKSRQQDMDRRERERERRLKMVRLSLYNEIRYITFWVNENIDEDAYEMVTPMYLTNAFEDNTNELPKLTQDEITSITNFYNIAISLKDLIEFRAENPEAPKEVIAANMHLLSEIGEQAMEALEDNLPAEEIPEVESGNTPEYAGVEPEGV